MDTVAQDRKKAIILFDGVCNLCNASVRFVISRDRGDRFRFAPLQSEMGRRLAENHALPENPTSTVMGSTITTSRCSWICC